MLHSLECLHNRRHTACVAYVPAGAVEWLTGCVLWCAQAGTCFADLPTLTDADLQAMGVSHSSALVNQVHEELSATDAVEYFCLCLAAAVMQPCWLCFRRLGLCPCR